MQPHQIANMPEDELVRALDLSDDAIHRALGARIEALLGERDNAVDVGPITVRQYLGDMHVRLEELDAGAGCLPVYREVIAGALDELREWFSENGELGSEV